MNSQSSAGQMLCRGWTPSCSIVSQARARLDLLCAGAAPRRRSEREKEAQE